MKNPRIAIIGGGITGLAAAYRLRQAAPEVDITLIEATARLGGKIGTERLHGFVLEEGPDCFLSRKTGGVALCEALGIADQLVGRDERYARTFVRRHGRLHRLPEGLTGMIPTNLDALANTSLLSAAAIARVAQEPNLPPLPANADGASGDAPAPDESVADFVIRRLGRETFENLVEPLMGGIYAGQAAQLSLAATFPQLRQLELKYGSLLKGLAVTAPAASQGAHAPFVSFPDGMQTLVSCLVEQLPGVEILRETAVTDISQVLNGYRLSTIAHQRVDNIHCAALIMTTPAYVSGQLLQGIDAALAAPLAAIPYASTALVNLAYDEADVPALAGYGYVIPLAEEQKALACTWTSRKWQGRAPAGKVLLRVYIGRYGEEDVTMYENGRLLAIAQKEIRETVNITARPLFHHITRHPRAMPQYNLGHLERLVRIAGRLAQQPGLFLAGAAFTGVGIPDCITSAEMAAAKSLAYLQEKLRTC